MTKFMRVNFNWPRSVVDLFLFDILVYTHMKS